MLHQTLASMGVEYISSITLKEMDNYRASTLVIERESLIKYAIDIDTENEKENRVGSLIRCLNELDVKTSKLVLKFYDEGLLEDIYVQSLNLQDHYKTFSRFLQSCHETYEREMLCLKMIAEHNEKTQTEKINCPSLLMRGDKLYVYFSEYMFNGYMGKFSVCNFIDADKELKSMLPLRQELIKDARRQLAILIEKLGIIHQDLTLQNLIMHNNQIFFIDFGVSTILTEKQMKKKQWLKSVSLEYQDELERILS
jgi:serine/threonine protein kinase